MSERSPSRSPVDPEPSPVDPLPSPVDPEPSSPVDPESSPPLWLGSAVEGCCVGSAVDVFDAVSDEAVSDDALPVDVSEPGIADVKAPAGCPDRAVVMYCEKIVAGKRPP